MFSINAGAAAGAPGLHVICIGLAEIYSSGRYETVCRAWMKPDVAVGVTELPKTGWAMQKTCQILKGTSGLSTRRDRRGPECRGLGSQSEVQGRHGCVTGMQR